MIYKEVVAKLAQLTRALVRAVVTGTVDPPPGQWRRRVRVPWFPGPRRPTVDLVRLGDRVLAFVLFAGGVAFMEGPAAAARWPYDKSYLVIVSAAFSLPLVLRDRWPLAAWRCALLSLPVGVSVTGDFLSPPYTPGAAIACLLVAYSAAVRCDRDITVGVWLVSSAMAVVIDVGTAVPAVIGVTVAVLFGYNVRARRLAAGKLAEQERRAEDAFAERAALAERARIARELHDVVAHHMSVIAIQAEAVPLQARGDAGLLAQGLAEIRTLSLKTMAEMRQVLGVLRDTEGAPATSPQPGLHLLDDLVATARGAGLTVTVSVSGELGDLPGTAGLTAYRIVQESLSNAMRHAPRSDVTVELTRDDGGLRIRVASSLPGEPGPTPYVERGPVGRRPGLPGGPSGHGPAEHGPARYGPAGHGLAGMRERVALLGGTFHADRVGEEFTVTATVPIRTEAG
ncbi:sensor histidine kinase [Microtetraspora glauca]|uniref:histidine kinase n=1 Tax=Microtetraspora glauca TaxID=1996 RepID=A0ABV3GHL1_MICGL